MQDTGTPKSPDKGDNALALSEKSREVQAMFNKIAPTYDFLNRLLSARQDVRWRKYLANRLPTPAQGHGVLYDVACGTGDVLFMIGKMRKDYTELVGVDISEGMIEVGRQRPEAQALKSDYHKVKLDFRLGSAEELPCADSSAHALSIAFGLRNVDNRMKALQDFHRVLKPGGRVLVLEFFEAESTVMAALFKFYFHNVLPVIGGIFSDRSAYRYLPKSVSTMPSGTEFKSMLEKAGFVNVTEKRWLAGATRLFTADKPV